LDFENSEFRIQKFGIGKFGLRKFGIENWKMKELFFGLGCGSKIILGPTYVDNQLWFWNNSPKFCFKFGHILGLFWIFWPFGAIFGPLGLFLGSGWLDIAILMKTKSSAFDFDFDWRLWVCQNFLFFIYLSLYVFTMKLF